MSLDSRRLVLFREKYPILFSIACVQTAWGCIAFAFNFCMIFIQNYVFGFPWQTNCLITALEWSADLLYITSGILVGLALHFDFRRMMLMYYVIYTFYLVYGWLVIIVHASMFPHGEWNWNATVYGVLVSSAGCLIVFVPYWFVFLPFYLGKCSKKPRSRLSSTQQYLVDHASAL
mmetsp:Transcript_10286/g.38212  ORF Transcript_10286/g.38212 Transcript_10286/m.38212 type:complete len:175 (-) Transcript_10286:886-1410(-)